MTSDLIDRRALGALNPRHRMFVLEWLLDRNGKRAAIAVGYSEKTATVRAAQILARNDVHRAICSVDKQIARKYELTLDMALQKVAHGCLRTSDDLIDPETGEIYKDMRRLGEHAKNTIDSIKQTVKSYTNDEGETDSTTTTEIRLMPMAAAVDMALKIKGAYAPEKHEVVVAKFDFDKLYATPPKPVDIVQQKIEQEKLSRSLLQDVIEGDGVNDGQTTETPLDAKDVENT